MFVAWMVAGAAQAQQLSLSFPQLAPGTAVEFRIAGLSAGESTTLVRGARVGPGACPAVLGGVCLDVTGVPVIVGSAVADANGVARLRVQVPAGAPNGLELGVQAVAVRGAGGVDSVTSNAVDAVVQSGPICPVYASPDVLPGGDGSSGQPYPSIGYAQAYRDASCSEILLYPGTYDENVLFSAEVVSVSSLEGRDTTFLTSSVGGTLVDYESVAGPGAVLRGVTLQCQPTPFARGIEVSSSSPTLTDLVVEGCDGVWGSAVHFTSAGGELSGSVIRGNGYTAVVSQNSSPVISGNTFTNNDYYGAGSTSASAMLVSGGSPIVDGNRFVANVGSGEYVMFVERATATVMNNLFTDNTGAGVFRLYYDDGSAIVNNTLHDNSGYGVYFYYSTAPLFANNIVSSQGSYSAYASGGTWVYENNDAFPASFGGSMGSPTGTLGNIAVDPRFVGGGDYGLVWGSPCIDRGQDASALGVTADLEGVARPRGLGYDMGAFESW